MVPVSCLLEFVGCIPDLLANKFKPDLPWFKVTYWLTLSLWPKKTIWIYCFVIMQSGGIMKPSWWYSRQQEAVCATHAPPYLQNLTRESTRNTSSQQNAISVCAQLFRKFWVIQDITVSRQSRISWTFMSLFVMTLTYLHNLVRKSVEISI